MSERRVRKASSGERRRRAGAGKSVRGEGAGPGAASDVNSTGTSAGGGIARLVIVGGGAAGLSAAIAAAQTAQQHPDLVLSVTMLDAGAIPGKKIPATGNGRCNLSNRNQQREYYRSAEGCLPEEFFRPGWEEEVTSFMHSIGILTHERRGGYIYPRTDQASAVQQALLRAAQHLGVEIRSGVRVIACRKNRDGRYLLTCDDSMQQGEDSMQLEADRILLASGGMAGKGYGCVGDGYRMACSLGHSLVTPVPALCALYTSDPQIRLASGIRTSAGIDLRIGNRTAAYAEGELQITDRSLSGIPAFQVSRYASAALHDQRRLSCEEAAGAESGQNPVPFSREGFNCPRNAAQEKAQAPVSPRDGTVVPQYAAQRQGRGMVSLQEGPGIPEKKAQKGRDPGSPQETVTAILNFLPELSLEEWEEECSRRVASIGPSDTLGDFCLGLVPDRIAAWILARHGLVREKKIANLSAEGVLRTPAGKCPGDPGRNPEQTAGPGILRQPPLARGGITRDTAWNAESDMAQRNISGVLKKDAGSLREEAVFAVLRPLLNDMRALVVPIVGTEGFDRAQVTAGGVPMDEVRATMESRLSPGCYLAGELLDVDGLCGGYNLTWAFHSGLAAGRNAVLSLLAGQDTVEVSSVDGCAQQSHC